MLGNIKQNLFRSWTDLGNTCGLSGQEVDQMWGLFISFYGQPHRHYHNLQHLAQMFALAEELDSYISEPSSFKLAIWFHDLIYKPTRKDNERKSAQKAEIFLNKWNFSKEKIDQIVELILSTAKHYPINDSFDNKLFLDTDLAILGSESHLYQVYIESIRKEYRIYPDFMYNYGRKKFF